MTKLGLRTLFVAAALLPVHLWGQGLTAPSQPADAKNDAQALPKLTAVRTVRVESEAATIFAPPLRCDGEGNLYLMNEPYGVSGIRKLNAKGERLALFTGNGKQEMKLFRAGYFALGAGGTVYQLAYPHSPATLALIYAPDGTYKSFVELHPGFSAPWDFTALGVFANGNLLVTGQTYDHNPEAAMWPYTAVFSPQGALLKEIKFEDDRALYETGARGDSRVTLPGAPAPIHNLAISSTQIESAEDGNLYLMRRLTPAIFYAIAPSGEVVRRFTVDPGDLSFEPWEMHISGDRMVVIFHNPQSWDTVLKIVDLEGSPIESYAATTTYGKDGNRKPGSLSGPLACYSSKPERFTFLANGDDNKLELNIVEPR